MDLGVRINTNNPELRVAFTEAMDFWSRVLDMTWHPVSDDTCSVQLVDGVPGLFPATDALIARSQIADRPGFEGWIAFAPHMPLTPTEFYMTAIHELGHIFGLQHNPSDRSVMYFMNLEGFEELDADDLKALARRHKLRIHSLEKPIAAFGPPSS